jgi:hypothetical protein
MKSINSALILVVILIGGLCQAGMNFKCINEAQSTLAFSLSLSSDAAVIRVVNRAIDGFASTLQGRTIKFVEVAANNPAYLDFAANVVVSKYSQDIQNVGILFNKSEIAKSSMRLILSVSNSTSDTTSYHGATVSSQYGMICTPLG